MRTTSSRDNWERLVAAVIKKDQIWQLCHQDSISTINSSDSSQRDLSFSSNSLRSVSASPSLIFHSQTLRSFQIDNLLGLLRLKVKRGVNLAIRDFSSSDPYVVIKMAKQKLKTRVIKKDVNPEWNEELTLSISDHNLPIHLTVYNHNTFSLDDKMGDAEFDIRRFIEAVKMGLHGLPDGTIITKGLPSRSNCLSEESCVEWKDGKVIQDMCLRLRNVECGEVEIELQWINVPGSWG